MIKDYRVIRGFTLIELIIVIVIIGVTASLGFSYFLRSRESTLGRDAGSALRIVAAAERVYRMESGSYWPTGSGSSNVLNNINANLRLRLSNTHFNYAVSATAATSFSATASRISNACVYTVNETGVVDGNGNCAIDRP